MDVQTQVIKFYSGQTTNNNTKYDVYFADGTKASAFEYAVGAKAEQAWKSGEQIIAHITEKPNPNGPNPYRNLTGITLLGAVGGAVAPVGSQPAQASQNGAGGAQKPLGGFSGGMTPEDKIRVTKLSCISSAAAIFGGSGDVDETLKAAKTIFTEVWGEKPAEQPVVAPEPAAIQEFVNAEAGAPVVQVGIEEKPVAALPWAVA